MLCNCRLPRRRDIRKNSTLKLTGTFDFRWPGGSTIRVAFQDCDNPKALDLLIQRVGEAFEAWGVYPSIDPHGASLAYQVLPKHYPAGSKVPASLLKEEEARVRQQIGAESHPDTIARLAREAKRFADVAGAATLAKATAVELARFGSAAFEYDVLISLTPMPVVIPGNEHLENSARVLIYGQSELGAYAKREDLGLPTAFLGRPATFTGDSEFGDSDLAWLNSIEGRFTIMHEVGHILGLAHEHQNPKRGFKDDDWRPEAEINQILTLRQMEPIYEDFIERELTVAFAMPTGAEPFSQWREPTDAETAGGLIDSVMVEPIYVCMLKHHQLAHDCLDQATCAIEQKVYQELQHPSELDRAQLLRLYPPELPPQPEAPSPSEGRTSKNRSASPGPRPRPSSSARPRRPRRHKRGARK